MNSKRIGNIGEAKVLAKFVEMGMFSRSEER